jgi:hypothetical protein
MKAFAALLAVGLLIGCEQQGPVIDSIHVCNESPEWGRTAGRHPSYWRDGVHLWKDDESRPIYYLEEHEGDALLNQRSAQARRLVGHSIRTTRAVRKHEGRWQIYHHYGGWKDANANRSLYHYHKIFTTDQVGNRGKLLFPNKDDKPVSGTPTDQERAGQLGL